MPSPIIFAPPVCASCKKPTILFCNGCTETPKATKTFYCSVECQKSDWPAHKQQCKRLQTIKNLYRAGTLLQDIFYMYRETLFDKIVVKVEEKDGKLIIWEGLYPPEKGPTEYIKPFPAHLNLKPEDKKTLLAFRACSDAVGFLHDITEHFLSGLFSSITEISVGSAPKRETVALDFKTKKSADPFPNYNYFLTHQIIHVTLKNGGGDYIIDLTGAQYGYYDPVIEYGEYFPSRAQFNNIISYDRPPPYFGGTKAFLWEMARQSLIRGTKIDGHGRQCVAVGVTEAVQLLNKETCQCVMGGTSEWEKEQNMSPEAMWKLSQDEFEERKLDLVRRIRIEILDFLCHTEIRAGIIDRYQEAELQKGRIPSLTMQFTNIEDWKMEDRLRLARKQLANKRSKDDYKI